MILSPVPDTPEEEVRQLLKRLARLKRNWPSEPSLKDLSPQTVTALLKHLAANKVTNQKLQLLWTFCYIVFYICFKEFSHDHQPLVFVFPVCLFLSFLWMYKEKTNHYVVYALTQTNDMRVLSLLLESTSQKYGRHPEIVGAIKRLLTEVTEAHVGLLNNEAQTRLWYFAVAPVANQEAHDLELGLIALQAFACIGNRDSLKRMQKFAGEPAVYPGKRRAHKALQELLPAMEARLKRQEVPQTLLRAASMPTSPPETLLRTAYASNLEPTEQLLRASSSEEREI